MIAAFFVGFLFAVGLTVSGMTDPQKVIGFLNITSNWNPSLIFVMASAIPVYMAVFFLVRRLKKPLAAKGWHLPTSKSVDQRLIGGAAIFGIGWGLGGVCPGPALVSLVTVAPAVIVFACAYAVGSWFEGQRSGK